MAFKSEVKEIFGGRWQVRCWDPTDEKAPTLERTAPSKGGAERMAAEFIAANKPGVKPKPVPVEPPKPPKPPED